MRSNLILWEKKNHYTAKEVAEKLGVSIATYYNIKYGKHTPSIEFAYKFIEMYPEVDVLELLKLD